jgi:DNA polymerase III epsilon subunit-like protein
LAQFEKDTRDVYEVVGEFEDFLQSFIDKYPNVLIVCDSAFDAGFMSAYLAKYSKRQRSLDTFRGANTYTGEPLITDDQARGVFKTQQLYGLDPQIGALYGEVVPDGDHHPTNDAKAIGRFMNFLKLTK